MVLLKVWFLRLAAWQKSTIFILFMDYNYDMDGSTVPRRRIGASVLKAKEN